MQTESQMRVTVNGRPLDGSTANLSWPTPSLLSRDEAACYLGISVATLRRLVNAGKVESVKIGSRRLFEIEALAAFVRESRQGIAA